MYTDISPIIIFVWFLIGCLTAYLAEQRGRDGKIWFVIGLFLGFIGLFILFFLPVVKREEIPAEPIPAPPVLAFKGKDWFYLDDERNQTGPVPFNSLVQAWKERKINESTYLWSEGMERWFKVNELNDVKSYLEL